mmetsp:Transcript_15059/g.36155  ORF Transcript_15059/g.36155 Transcript_15059/m.36155 type:complete len:122 (-) Transcript_15059:93-458(-)
MIAQSLHASSANDGSTLALFDSSIARLVIDGDCGITIAVAQIIRTHNAVIIFAIIVLLKKRIERVNGTICGATGHTKAFESGEVFSVLSLSLPDVELQYEVMQPQHHCRCRCGCGCCACGV